MPFLETLEAWSFRLFGPIAPSFLKNVFEFKKYLERAKIKIYPETYVSLMFFTALLTVPMTLVSVVMVLLYGLMPIIFLIPTPFYVMIGFLVIPMSRASERASNLERNAVCHRLRQRNGFRRHSAIHEFQTARRS